MIQNLNDLINQLQYIQRTVGGNIPVCIKPVDEDRVYPDENYNITDVKWDSLTNGKDIVELYFE